MKFILSKEKLDRVRDALRRNKLTYLNQIRKDKVKGRSFKVLRNRALMKVEVISQIGGEMRIRPIKKESDNQHVDLEKPIGELNERLSRYVEMKNTLVALKEMRERVREISSQCSARCNCLRTFVPRQGSAMDIDTVNRIRLKIGAITKAVLNA